MWNIFWILRNLWIYADPLLYSARSNIFYGTIHTFCYFYSGCRKTGMFHVTCTVIPHTHICIYTQDLFICKQNKYYLLKSWNNHKGGSSSSRIGRILSSPLVLTRWPKKKTIKASTHTHRDQLCETATRVEWWKFYNAGKEKKQQETKRLELNWIVSYWIKATKATK